MKTLCQTVSFTCLGTVVFLSGVSAQIKTDASLGQSARTLIGPNFAITSDLGKQVGDNLFHSFSTFNLVKGDIATFSGPSTVSNIISRVTGGQASSIDGTLKSTINGANLYFLNPAGIIFGPSSSVDIIGSFHVTTADYLKLGTDGRFDAANPANSTLTISPPSAFGFLSAKPAALTVNGAGSEYAFSTYGLNGLYVKSGKEISLIGGDISLNSGVLDQKTAGFYLIARGGRLNMASVASGGEVAIEDNNIAMNGFTRLGNITLGEGGMIDLNPKSFSGPSGNIYVRGNTLQSKDFAIGAFSNDSYVGGHVDIRLTGDVSLDNSKLLSSGGQYYQVDHFAVANGSKLTVFGEKDIVVNASQIDVIGYDSTIKSAYAGVNKGGNINLQATKKVSIGSSLATGHEATVWTVSESTGNAGNISINTPVLDLVDYGLIQSWTSLLKSTTANSGDISITSKNVTIANASSIRGEAGSFWTDASGKGSNISIITDNLSMIGGSTVMGSVVIASHSSGTGGSGNIYINAAKNMTMNGNSILQGAAISTSSTVGRSGDIVIITDNGLIEKGTYISSLTEDGIGGQINLSANVLTFQGGEITSGVSGSGTAGKISITANNKFQLGGTTSSLLPVDTISQLDALALSAGNAGSIAVNAKEVVVGHGGKVSVANYGTGKSGDISIVSDFLNVNDGATIDASTSGGGHGGTVSVNVGTLLVDGASSTINARAAKGSSGQTGSVTVQATDKMTISNGGVLSIQNDATVTNPASLSPTLLTVTAPTVVLKDAKITAASTGNVSASSIQITASDRLSIDPSSISTSANLGDGGSITIQGGKMMTLDNSQITTSVAGQKGNGGDIHVTADTLMMNTGFIQANTAAANATGGLVGIDVQMLVPSGSSLFVGGQTPHSFQSGVFGFNVIQAAAPTGVSGTIQMASPALDIAGSLNGLSTQVINPGGLGRSPCQITGGNSLAQSGRGGLAPSALGLLRAEPDMGPDKSGAPTLGKANLPLTFTPGRCS